MQAYDYERIKKQVNAELELYPGKFTAYRVMSFLLNEIFSGDYDAAKRWMLSNQGGFSNHEISRTLKERRKNKSKALDQAQAF